MVKQAILNHASLREQVYEHLRQAINRGDLTPGAFLDQTQISTELGISKQPLRDALIQLETEGFVKILPRRGVVVSRLTLDDIRHLYEVVGALEGAAVVSVFAEMTDAHFREMRMLNADMVLAIDDGDFDTYYRLNLAFHNVFLGLSDNEALVRSVELSKQRLYDFPRAKDFVPDWELSSVGEHAQFVDYLETGDRRSAADYLRDVHWSFGVQRSFILRYYFPDQTPESSSRTEF
jgi:DNA-binding GntR family transcriptional regulator